MMTNCVLNPGLKTIGKSVFLNCSALTDIVIPDSVENFGSSFSGCNALTNCVMPKNLAGWEAAAAAYPDYVQLPAERSLNTPGWWKGGYRGSAKTILRWWYDPGTLILIR